MTTEETAVLSTLAKLSRKWYVIGAIGVGLLTGGSSALATRAANQATVSRVDSLQAALVLGTESLSGRVDSVAQVLRERDVIIRAIGVDLCLRKDDDFVVQTGLPCEQLLAGLRFRRQYQPASPQP